MVYVMVNIVLVKRAVAILVYAIVNIGFVKELSQFWCMLLLTLFLLKVLRVLSWFVFVSYIVLNILCSQCLCKMFSNEFTVPIGWQGVRIVCSSASKRCAY